MADDLKNVFNGQGNGAASPKPPAVSSTKRAPIHRDNVTRLQQIALLGGPNTAEKLTGHISWLGLSRDGARLAAAGYQDFSLWDTAQGKRLFHSSANYRYAALSADGAYCAASGYPHEQQIDILDARSGALLHQITTQERVYALAFSPDGRWLAASYYPSTQVVLYAVSDWQRAFSMPLTYICMGLAFTHDSQRLALSCSQEINPMNGTWANETHLCRVEEDSLSPIFRIAAGHEHTSFSPDGELLAIGGQIFNARSGTSVQRLNYSQLSFSADSALVLAKVFGPTPLWIDISSGQTLHHLPNHPPSLAAQGISGDGTLLATAHGGSFSSQAAKPTPLASIRLWAVPA